MKVLWIINTILPELADYMGVPAGFSGTWMHDLSQQLGQSDDVELGVACIYGDKYRDIKIGNIRYFVIPGTGKTMLFYNPGLIRYWDIIEQNFCPDILHFHGTEYTHGISYMRKYPEKKKVLTIQGIIAKTSKAHTGGMRLRDMLKFRTFAECINFNGMIERKILSGRNVKYETEIIKNVSYATGRTDWDKFYMKSINPQLKYFRCNYNLRKEFYSADKWNIDKINRNTIYASTSAQVPMKGGHIVLRALDIVRRKYPDVKVTFLANKAENGHLIVTNGYTKYIQHMINQLDLSDNVNFISQQRTDGIISQMQKNHITLIPSAIENASASLREAMHIGAPCIAAFRGGMTRLIDDEESGFLYDYGEYEYLAGRIIEILDNDELALKLSHNAVEKAEVWHDREKNTQDYIDMYKSIMSE